MENFENANLGTHFFELSQDLMCVAGFDGYFKTLNPAWEKLLGYSEKELLSKPFLTFIHPDDHGKNDEEVANLSKGNATLNFENRYICKNGSIKHFEWTATPVPEKKIIYCIGRDITGRKKSEAKFIEQSSNLKFLNSLAIPFTDIHTLDKFSEILLKGLIKHTGASLVAFSYYHSEKKELQLLHVEAEKGILNTIIKIAGKKISKTVSPVDDQAYQMIVNDKVSFYSTFSEVTFGAIPKPIDEVIRLSTGIDRLYPIAHVIEGELYGTTMLAFKKEQNSPSNELLHSYAHLLSVALRRYNAEKALEESEKKFRQLFENMEQGFALHEIIYDKSGKVIDYKTLLVNEKYEEYLNVSKASVIGKNASEILPGEELKKWLDVFKNVALAGKAKKYSFYSDHNKKYFDGIAYQTEKGKFAVAFSDTTERKLSEEKLQESYHLLNKLTSMVPGVVYQYRLYPNGHSSFPVSSSGMWDMYEVTPEEVREDASAVFTRLHPDDYDIVVERINDSAKNLTNYHQEFRVVLPKQGLRWRQCDAKPQRLKDGSTIWYGIITDITERKKAEDEILIAKEEAEESEKRFQLFVNQSPSPLAVVDKNMEQILYWSDSAIQKLGHSPNTAEEWFRVAYPDSKYRKKVLEQWSPMVEKAVKTQKATNTGEYEVTCKDGSVINCEFYIQFIADYFIITLNDVTERRKVENEIIKAKELAEKSELRFKAIWEQAMDGIALTDLEDRYVFVNRSFCEMMGYTEQELLKLKVFDVIATDAETHLFDQIKKDHNKGNSARTKLVRKDKSIIYVDLNGGFLDLGKEQYVLGIHRNVTELVNRENELNKYTKHLESLNNSLIDVVFTVNPEDRKIKYVNKAIETVFGYSQEECRGLKTAFLYSDEQDYKKFGEKLKNAILNKRDFLKAEMQLKRKNGKIFSAEITTTFVKENDEIIEILSIIRDVSEKIQYQNELIEAKEKAEESDHLKSAFLANMSHEIRTPMNGILGFTSLLKEPDLSGEKQKEFIDIIERSGARMLNTINDIIDISKIESGQVELVFSAINLNKLLDEQFEFFLPEAGKKNIKLTVSKSPTEQVGLNSDKEKLNSIFTNLIKNAIKYTHSGSIEFGYLKNEVDNENELRFYVKDTGIGIPPDRKDAVFKRFEQADVEDKQVYEGSGLGLAISKAYVEMLGGKIWVESKEGVGSEFYFTLPFNSKENVKSENSNVASNQTYKSKKKLKILIVEDEEFSTVFLEIVLKPYGKEILTAKSGKEAVEFCKMNPDLDIILMDIKMPGMDGYEATRLIREFNKEVFILAQTAYAQVGDREKVLKAGCNEYISKPINKDELLKIISTGL